MERKILTVMAFAVLVLSIGITPAFAMSGAVETTGGLKINGAWVTSEKANDYKKTTQPSTGDWSLSVAGNGNTVSGAPYLYNRGVETGVDNNAINVDFSLTTRSAETMEYVIAVDDMSTTTMRSHINGAKEYFQFDHSINFSEDSSTTWSHGTKTKCSELLTEVQNDVSWSTLKANSDFLIAFVNIQMKDDDGTTNIHACTDGVGGSTASPVIVIGNTSPDYVRTIMHEITHDYEIDHDGTTCSSQTPNVMAFGASGGSPCSSQYIKNWTPSQDTTMESRRGWY
ncbi:hypothetical protein [Nitrosopumilus sp.]|uniref:hypothetical protein n=1 Tax=Nitrosopumilus sp. TaxID=2024843 RepID=UPI00349FD851